MDTEVNNLDESEDKLTLTDEFLTPSKRHN